MSAPTLSVSADALEGAAIRVVPAIGGEGGPRIWPDGGEDLSAALSAIGFQAGKDELVRLPQPGGAVVAVIGLGDGEVTGDALRYAAGSAVRQLAGVSSVAFDVPVGDPALLEALLEGAALGAYSFGEYRVFSAKSAKAPVATVTVRADGDAGDAVKRAAVTAEAAALVKDLVNRSPLDLYPESLADAAQTAAAGLPVEVKVWDEEALAADGFGGVLGVGSGSARGPRLVKVCYSPAGAGGHVALVGKGITFDSGGLSLKPPASMVGMKYDMTGAATVLAVVLAAARLDLPLRVTAWLCLAENMPSGSAIRPNDVLRIHGGRTVEVLNTDAEGRLVLADGLVAASEEEPDAIIDVATLTGAQVVALGTRYSAVMGDDALVGRLVAAAAATGEQFWPMPLPGELRARLNSDVADISNATPGNTAAGMLLAGVFLQEFIGLAGDQRIPWAHLDIAGPSHNKGSAYGFTGTGPTAVGVRALLRLLRDFTG